MSAKDFCYLQFKKRGGQPGLFTFLNETTTKKTLVDIWCLVFWHLVTGQSNEKIVSIIHSWKLLKLKVTCSKNMGFSLDTL